MTVLRDVVEITDRSSTLPEAQVHPALRVPLAVFLPIFGWVVAVAMCIEVLVVEAPAVARYVIVLAAAVPATGSLVGARALLRRPVRSIWLLLGVLPSIAGGVLLTSVV